MDISDQMEHLRDGYRRQRAEGELDDAQRQNLSLKAESRLLRDEVRGDLDELSSAIDRLARRRGHRPRRLLTLAGIAAGAYVMGARSGRGRYEQLRDAAETAIRRGRAAFDGVRDRADDLLDGARVVSDRVSEASQVVGETAASLAEGPVSAQGVDGGPSFASPRSVGS